MITLISIIFSYIYFKLDITQNKIFAVPCSLFIIMYSLSFDCLGWEDLESVCFQYARPKFGFQAYLLLFITIISFGIGISSLKFVKIRTTNLNIHYNTHKLSKIYYYFAFFSIAAFIINITRVFLNGGLGLIFINPREYEATFGANFLINYFYFLNVPALCVYLYLRNQNIKLKYGIIINIILLSISFFHGIKFTIFDTILYPTIFYYLLRKNSSIKPIAIVFSILITIFILFSVFVRGGTDKSPLLSVASYIFPNYYNLAYNIEQSPVQFGQITSLFLPDKIPNPTNEIAIGEPVSGFALNESYNMYTSLFTVYYAFNFFGPLFYLVIFIIQYYFYLKRNQSILSLFISTYLYFCLIFSFYFYAYTKFKNVYYVLIFILIHYICKHKLTTNINKINI